MINTKADFNKEEATKFIRIVHHDDRNSFYFVGTKIGDGFSERACDQEHLLAEIAKSAANPESNTYVTINAFVSPRGGRKTANARQIDGAFIDIDAHELIGDALDSAVCQGLESIHSAIAAGDIPAPTMIVHSGRGIHIYYVYTDSIPYMLGRHKPNIKGMISHRMFVDALCARIEDVVDGTGISVDKACSDLSRYVRVPGTLNPKTGTMCHLVVADGPTYTFDSLRKALT